MYLCTNYKKQAPEMSYNAHKIAQNSGFADYDIVGCCATLCALGKSKLDNF